MASKKQIRAATLALLRETFPQTFNDTPRPLKLNVRADILAALKGKLSDGPLGDALRVWCNSTAYLNRLRAGVARVDLNGKPCGAVTAEEAAFAKDRLAGRQQRRPEPSPPAIVAKSAPKPASSQSVKGRHDPFAGLRAAAQARRAAVS